MSGEDTFIARWSRLKRSAALGKEPRTGAKAEDGARPAGASAQPASRPPAEARAKPVETEPPFDPASLPPIESIVAGSDIRAFLQKGVPAALTKAALRQAWTADPAIRDFIEVAENQWDFTDPTAIPGFGSMQAGDNLRQLVGQAMGKLEELPDAAAPLDEGHERHASAAEHVAPELRSQGTRSEEQQCNQDTAGDAALRQPAPAAGDGTTSRRRGHGRAMPR
jgi:hypothetical protein